MVLPGNTVSDMVDGHRRHAELLGKDPCGGLGVKEDFLDVLLRKLRSSLHGPPSVPEPSHHVPNVVLRCAELQVFRVDAEPVVALVTDNHPLRDGTVVLHVDEPMEPDGGIWRYPDNGVPIVIQRMGDADVATLLVLDIEDLVPEPPTHRAWGWMASMGLVL
jgi:hypothetical protein